MWGRFCSLSIWSWLVPLVMTRDADIIKTAGLDALMVLRMHSMGLQLFLPWSVLGCAVLLPLYYSSGPHTLATASPMMFGVTAALPLHHSSGPHTLATASPMMFGVTAALPLHHSMLPLYYVVGADLTVENLHGGGQTLARSTLMKFTISNLDQGSALLWRAYLLSHDFASPSVDDVLHRAATVPKHGDADGKSRAAMCARVMRMATIIIKILTPLKLAFRRPPPSPTQKAEAVAY
ncbi:MAG: hypothetical protein WDW38_008692 [Sanguina aurantia]